MTARGRIRRLLPVLGGLVLVASTGGRAGAQGLETDSPAWRILAGSRVAVYHVAEDSAVADRYLRFLQAQPPLPALPDSLPTGVDAYMAPDAETFQALLGGRVPEWSGGVAVPALDMLVVPAYSGSMTRLGEAARVLRHEWAHLGLHQYLRGLRIPRWLDEGYAEWAGGWDATRAWRLRVLFAVGGAPPLDSISFHWPGDRTSAEAAYLIAATAVEYLVEESGERGLRIFFTRWRETGHFEDALRRTYGVGSGHLEEDWREWAENRYGWLYVLSHSMVFWALLGLGLLLMVRIRRRHRREQMARLRAEEPPERPAYWLGEDS